MIIPIWQDYYVDFKTDESPINYSIRLKDEAIFYGKAWAAPSYTSGIFSTNITKICEDYLSNDFFGFTGVPIGGRTYTHTDAIKKFKVVNEDKEIIIDTVTFVYDWSYDGSVRYGTGVTQMSHPINNKGKEGMYFFQTTCDGESVKTFVSLEPVGDYQLVNDCNSKWALYYLNRYGGWDSYLIDGYVSRKDVYTRRNIVKEYNNNFLEFGTKPYMTEVTVNYEIHTGWMNDAESEIMAANLFPSTRIYLHNLETQEIVPLTITDAETLYKNHKNSGRRLLNYTINAMSSQTEHNKN
jgi:hypothetical protein